MFVCRLDDQIWGSDEEKDENEEEEDNMNDEEEGKGSKDEEDIHNDLANKNDDTTQGEDEQEGLDAADSKFILFTGISVKPANMCNFVSRL